MLYIHATTSGSWFSQKENKNIGRSLISPLQINSYFYSYTLINGYNSYISLTSYKILQFSLLKDAFPPG